MIRIALCDDERKVLDEVSFYINKYSKARNNHRYEIACFDSVTAIMNALEDEKNFDIYQFWYSLHLTIDKSHKIPLGGISISDNFVAKTSIDFRH